MDQEKQQAFSQFFKRLFADDKKVRLITIIGVVGILLIFLSQFLGNGDSGKKQQSNSEKTFSAEEYAARLEERLGTLIAQIDGAGKAEVMITLKNSGEIRYLKEISTESDNSQSMEENGKTSASYHLNRSEEYLVLDGADGRQVLEETRLEPEIQGIVVICEGGGSPITQEKILDAVSKLFGISSARVHVSKLADGR